MLFSAIPAVLYLSEGQKNGWMNTALSTPPAILKRG